MTRCLIIDDDPLMRKMASDILTRHGISVHEAATGQEGLQKATTVDADIVLLDVVLPDASGYDLLPRLSGGVIVTTSHFSMDSALKALREGASDYLPKPFSEESLLMSIERVLKRQTLERQKMAALGLLAAGVAHEINNPLSFVNANLDALKQYVRSLRKLSGVMIHARARADRDSSAQEECILKKAGQVIDEEKLGEVLDDLGRCLTKWPTA